MEQFTIECREESGVLYSVIGLPFNQSDAANPASCFPALEPLTYISLNFDWHFSSFFTGRCDHLGFDFIIFFSNSRNEKRFIVRYHIPTFERFWIVCRKSET